MKPSTLEFSPFLFSSPQATSPLIVPYNLRCQAFLSSPLLPSLSLYRFLLIAFSLLLYLSVSPFLSVPSSPCKITNILLDKSVYGIVLMYICMDVIHFFKLTLKKLTMLKNLITQRLLFSFHCILSLFLILPGGILSGFKLTQRAQYWIERLWMLHPWLASLSNTSQTCGYVRTHTLHRFMSPEVLRVPPCHALLRRLDRPCMSTPTGQKIVVSNPLSIQNCLFDFLPSVCIHRYPPQGVCWIGMK